MEVLKNNTIYVKLNPIQDDICILDIKNIFNIDNSVSIQSYKIDELFNSIDDNIMTHGNIILKKIIKFNGEYNKNIYNLNNNDKINDVLLNIQINDLTYIIDNVNKAWNFKYNGQAYNYVLLPYLITLNCTGPNGSFNKELYLNIIITNPYYTHITFNNLQGKTIGDSMQSFMLLRTNPKLTGNIKLVVDSQNNLYLDTFKISSNSILNDRRFRHQSISYDGNYAHDVKTVFSSIPHGELFGVYTESYNPHKGYYKIENQKYTIYEYGAENNFDSLYSENMKILAPLHIGKSIPEYFCIFKTNHLVNKETYNNIDINDTAVMQRLLKEGEIIKIYDLRNSTPVGHYLNAYKDSIQEYISNSCYLQFNEQDNIKGSSEHRQGRNSWKGISIDKGILTEKVETSYFISKILEQNNKIQEDYNMFILQGYERNNLLYPNIINLEFMFNDETADDFSMHNYFGLYMSGNTIYDIEKCLYINSNNTNINLYIKNKSFIDNTNNIKETINNISDIKIPEDHIIFGVTQNKSEVIKNSTELLDYIKTNVVNKPQKVIGHIQVEDINLNNIQSFLTVNIERSIMYGEHFRFVYQTISDEDQYTHYHIVDIISSNNEMYKTTANNISLYPMYNNLEDYENDETEKYNEDIGFVTVEDGWYRKNLKENYNIPPNTKIHYTAVCYYSQELEDNNKQAPLNIQFQRIQAALSICGHDIYVSSYSDTNIVFASNTISDIDFIHMYHTQNIINPQSIKENINVYNNLKVCNNPLYYTKYNQFLKDEFSFRYMYNDIFLKYSLPGLLIQTQLNLFVSYIPYKFIQKNLYKNYNIYQTSTDLQGILDKVDTPLISTYKGYDTLYIFNLKDYNKIIKQIFYNFNLTTYYMPSPIDASKNMFMLSNKVKKSSNNYIDITTPMNMQLQIMGIHNVKDFDMTVDHTNYNTYNISNNTITFKKGDIIKLDDSDRRLKPFTIYSFIKGTFLNIPKGDNIQFMYISDYNIFYINNKGIETTKILNNNIILDEDVIIKLADYGNPNSFNITTSDPVLESKNYYISKDKKDTLSIPIVPSVNIQWESNGLYYDGNNILDVNNINNEYIKKGFLNNIYTTDINNNSIYNINDIGRLLKIPEADKKFLFSFQDLLSNNLYEYPIKKMLYSNNSTIKTAIGYYNKYVQTLEFIYYGIKFIIKFTNVDYNDDIKLSDYNNYQVFMLNDYNGKYVNDIYISNKEQFILIINHSYDYNNKYVANNIIKFNNNIELPSYNFFELPYNIDLYNLYNKGNNMYITTVDSILHKKYIDDNVKYIIEYDTDNSNNYNSAKGSIYTYFSNDKSSKDLIIDGKNTMLYINGISYGYNNLIKLSELFQNDSGNYRNKHTYIIKQKNDKNERVKSELDKFISTFINNDINMHIIPYNGKTKNIYINKDYKPVEIKISQPNYIKYNHGFFKPVFKDIITFENQDYIIDTDLLLSNTKIKKVNSLINYPCNKVYNNMVNINENFFLLDNYNIFSTDWDNNIYRQYSSENEYTIVPGYTNGIIDKSLFGSKCIKLSSEPLIIDSWINAITKDEKIISKYNQHTNSIHEYILKLNITKALHDYIISTPAFINNWNNIISSTADLNTTYNNFIVLTLNKAFNTNNIKNLKIYRKTNSNLQLNISNGKPTDIENYTLCDNYKTNYEIVNNEVILNITLQNMYNYNYYITLQIERK